MASSADSTVLLADLGGTNIRFALADAATAMPLRDDSIRRYRVDGFPSLAQAARGYLDEIGSGARSGVFAVAGRVDGDSVRITNHPWTIGIEATRAALGMDNLIVKNDFEAMAHSLLLLAPTDLRSIGPARPPTVGSRTDQTFAVVGPGTGLGVGGLFRRDGHYHAIASEGGHIAFAAGTDEEIEVLKILHRRFGRVSVERVVSGQGLTNLYLALCKLDGRPHDDLSPADVTDRAGRGVDAACVRAVELCAALLGSIAGDFVLAYGGWDGVYLAGGLAIHLLPWLERGAFRERFEDKGRFASAMTCVPSQAIVHHDPGLLGAAAVAALAVNAPLGHGERHTSSPRTPR